MHTTVPLVFCVLLSLAPCLFANMNVGGLPYKIGNPSSHGTYSTEFSDEYFDVYSQVQTRYSQVYWTRNDPTPLPADIVARFKGKVMAITGYEIDQVQKTPQGDKSFPMFYAYNHHYFGWLLGEDSEMVRLDKPETPASLTNWIVKDKPNSHGFPTNIVFKENPGGEYRKSYHGYPNGFAQLIHSPVNFSCEPMQIDTHNRDYDGPGYKPWFWPKSVTESNWDPNSKLNPLIECPCTDRVSRVIVSDSSLLTSGVCSVPITSANDCFTEAKTLVQVSSSVNVNDNSLPYGCILSPVKGKNTYTAIFNGAQSGTVCGPSETLAGVIRGRTTSLVDLTVQVDATNNNVTIIMAGQDGVWFAVGFNAVVMADTPYTIVVDGFGAVTERKLANHKSGTVLQSSVKVLSNTVVGGIRTVVVQRGVSGITPDHYTFPTAATTIKFINAYGNTPDFEYHQDRTGAKIVLAPADVNSCVCQPTETTWLAYMNKSMTEYNVYCAPEPRGDMLQQNNPACKMQTYHGGLQCCHHQWFLTDVEQDSLIPAAVDTYYLKFRFYFQEYVPGNGIKPPSHYHLHHWVFLIDEAINDYEETACEDGTMCEAYISAHLQAKDMGIEDIPASYTGIMPLVMAAHCHAPSCIREELYNADTGELLCRVTATYGNGTDVFNEDGYVALPPCLFGFQDGLRPPIVLAPNTNLTAIKVFNNTFRHYGQMAQWTGVMVYLNNNVVEDKMPIIPEISSD